MIFWNYIKGLNGKKDSQDNTITNLIYSYLVWSKEKLSDDPTIYEKYRPELIVSNKQKLEIQSDGTYKDSINLGKVLTEKGGWKFVHNDGINSWNFRWGKKENNIEDNDNLIITNTLEGNEHSRYIYTPHYRCQFLTVMDRLKNSVETNGNEVNWDYNTSILNCQQGNDKNERHIIMLHNRIHFLSDNDGTKVGSDRCSAKFDKCDIIITEDSTFTAGCTINANSFNATSDIRAKTNIKPLLMSATNYLSNLKLYSYNYKSDNSKSIGIIAQEVEQQPIKDLNNEEILNLANAPKDDKAFYTIKQDKLVYLCIKAIQEQNEEIKILKKEIENLKLYSQK